MDTFYTVKEAALAAGRHPETIRDALRTGELLGTQRKKGGTWWIAQGSLLAWMGVPVIVAAPAKTAAAA